METTVNKDSSTFRRFILQRHADITGVSGTGVVAEGVEFSNGVVALQWKSAFPTSVVFHQRGMESVEAIHGHSGSTRIVFLDKCSQCGGTGTYPTLTRQLCSACRGKQ